ncbi:hypothetical protein I316_01450 [Kwoniella heveanensis BCC8398]|uniref:Peroxin/Ferlin domain-containing protein n=1 Tax=Kwoniella heveanensis BCC8398 TaxID=1296120 RepID=A0A1B9H0P5_9TREE|nr:hypothetical protein I316_01450 [Kwoniella heveanensis BCC8398]
MAPVAAGGLSNIGDSSQQQTTVLQSSDIITSIPGPLLRLLVLFARPISLFRDALEVLSWRAGRRVQSWMVVGAWWAVCLGAGHAFMYLLPPLIFSPLLPLPKLRMRQSASSKQPIRNTVSQPSTSETVLVTLSDLNSIYALIPPSPLPSTSSVYERFKQLGPVRLVRGLIVLWATWIALGYTIGYHTLLGIIGSVVLLFPSPPLAHLVSLLSRSLFFRRALALAFLFTFGSPPETSYQFSISHFSPLGWLKSKWTVSRRPSLAFSFRPKMAKPAANESALDTDEEGQEGDANGGVGQKVEQPIYFRFEVHENQRWWMGLDWTSALLPQERPSWCDLHLQPVSPPQSFSLPATTSVVVPAPTPDDPNGRVLRTASWKWLDEDWSIVRAGPGLAGATHVPIGGSTQYAPAGSTSPIVPSSVDDSSGYSVNPQSQAQSKPHHHHHHNQQPSSSSSRPTSFISSFGTSPPKGSGLEESTLSPGARAQSIAEQAFTKGLERLKARTASVAAGATASSSSPRKSFESTRVRTGSQASTSISDDAHGSLEEIAQQAQVGMNVPVHMETIVEKDDATDVDGWVYGDNKWEGMSAKGGLGKFTRRRRWQRRAVLIETITRLKSGDGSTDNGDTGPSVDPEPTLIVPPSAPLSTSASNSNGTKSATNPPHSSPLKARPAPAVKGDTTATFMGRSASTDEKSDIRSVSGDKGKGAGAGERGIGLGLGEGTHDSANTGVSGSTTGTSTARDDVLRLRLKKAMGSVGG